MIADPKLKKALKDAKKRAKGKRNFWHHWLRRTEVSYCARYDRYDKYDRGL